MKKLLFVVYLMLLCWGSAFGQTVTRIAVDDTRSGPSSKMLYAKNGDLYYTSDFGLYSFDGVSWTEHFGLNTDYSHFFSTMALDTAGLLHLFDWRGMGKLYKYDGNQLTQIAVSVNFELGGQFIIDKQNRIWGAGSGINGNGIWMFDGSVTTVFDTTNSNLGNNAVGSFAEDTAGVIWAGTTTGIAKYDGNSWQLYDSIPTADHNGTIFLNGKRIVIERVNQIVVDPTTNHLWMRIYQPTLGLSQTYLVELDQSLNVLTSFYPSDTFPHCNGLGINNQKNISFSSDGTLWITSPSGLLKYSNGQFSCESETVPSSIGGTYKEAFNVIVNPIDDKPLVSYEYTLAHHTANGPEYFYPTMLQPTYINSFQYNSSMLSRKAGRFKGFDSQGNYYRCTTGGLNKFTEKGWQPVVDILIGGSSDKTYMTIDQDDNFWILSARDTLYKFDGQRIVGRFHLNDIMPRYNWCSYDMVFDKSGMAWFNGNLNFDGSFVSRRRLVEPDTWNYFNLVPESNLKMDALGNLWGLSADCSYPNGVQAFRFHRVDGDSSIYFFEKHPLLGATRFPPNDYEFAPDGSLWVVGGGLYRFDGNNWESHLFDPGDTLVPYKSLEIDKDGVLWVLRGYELFKYDQSTWQKVSGSWHHPDSSYSGPYGFDASSLYIGADGVKYINCGSGSKAVKYDDGGPGRYEPIADEITRFRGKVYWDENQNGIKDTNEIGLGSQIIERQSGPLYTSSADSTGRYKLFGQRNALDTLSYIAPVNWFLTTPGSIPIYTDTLGQIDSLDFGIACNPNVTDVAISLNETRMRCNAQVNFSINYMNQGITVESGTITLEIDSALGFVGSSDTNYTQSGNQITWVYNNLAPFQTGSISVLVTVPAIGGNIALGDTVNYSVSIQTQGNDIDTSNNYCSRVGVIRCSFDPNDKLVNKGVCASGYTLMDEELEYTVRFQNTGNDTAYNVYISDVMDAQMHPSTLRILGSSHPMELNVRDNGVVTFAFNNIMLPDSGANQAESNGFVKFAISPRDTINIGSEVANTAYIYFDNNYPIKTNTTLNTYVDQIPVDSIVINHTICYGESYESHNQSGTYTKYEVKPDGCKEYTTLNLSILTQNTSSINQNICYGNNFESYTATGVYIDTLSSAFGCDSIRQINLTVLDTVMAYETASICFGDSYSGYSQTGMYYDTLIGLNGCDSTRVLNLTVLDTAMHYVSNTICFGDSYLGYSQMGLHYDTLIGSNGCDSIRVLNLTVLDTAMQYVSNTICLGDSYLGYTQMGMHYDTLIGSNGCDSIRVLNLTVLDTAMRYMSNTICFGESYLGYMQTGIYHDTLTSANGCDSTRILDLTVLAQNTSTVHQSICFGESFESYNSAGIYYDTLTSTFGCDSIRQLNLTVLDTAEQTMQENICDGESYAGYSSAGTYTDVFIGANGCDSTRHLILSVDLPASTNVTETINQDDSIWLAGEYQTVAGVYYDTLQTTASCDSVVKTTLSISTGINETLLSNGITIYPNPTKGLLHIEINRPEAIKAIRFYDIIGGEVMYLNQVEATQTLNLNPLATGMYFIVVETETGNIIKKVVKE